MMQERRMTNIDKESTGKVVSHMMIGKKGALSEKCALAGRLRSVGLVAVGAAALLVAGCSGLSDKEKSMVGKYYVPAVSDTRPLMELNGDRSSVLRAIKPGELSYYVTGEWHIDGDSLIIVNDVSSITIEEGDASLVGHVAPRIAYPVTNYNESTLTIERQGIEYDYHRRNE